MTSEPRAPNSEPRTNNLTSEPRTANSRKSRNLIFFIIVNVLSLVCLAWFLHGLNFRQLMHDFAHLHWGWVSLAVATNLLSYVFQGWRWKLVLAPVAAIPIGRSIRAVYVGVYANEVLPLRSGEIIRAYLLARSSELPMSVTLASVLIERVFDGIWLVVAMFVTLHMVELPRFIKDSGIFVGVLILIGGGLLAVAMYWREQTLDLLLNARWFSWIHVLIQDLHLIGHSRYLYYAFFLSLPFGLLQVLPVYAVLRAYDPLSHLPFIASVTVAIALRFNATLPQGPGQVGTYAGAVWLGLNLKSFRRITKILPAAPVADPFGRVIRQFSAILFAIMTVPLLIAGFIAVAFTGTKLGDIHREAKTSMQDRAAVPVADTADESAGLS
jgi:uncharacterized protein (TIRG00374 family)